MSWIEFNQQRHNVMLCFLSNPSQELCTQDGEKRTVRLEPIRFMMVLQLAPNIPQKAVGRILFVSQKVLCTPPISLVHKIQRE